MTATATSTTNPAQPLEGVSTSISTGVSTDPLSHNIPDSDSAASGADTKGDVLPSHTPNPPISFAFAPVIVIRPVCAIVRRERWPGIEAAARSLTCAIRDASYASNGPKAQSSKLARWRVIELRNLSATHSPERPDLRAGHTIYLRFADLRSSSCDLRRIIQIIYDL